MANPAEQPESLGNDMTRAGDLPPASQRAPRPAASLGDLATNADIAGSISDLGGFDDAVEDIGEIVDLAKRYEITGTLGRGGMGEVLQARDRRLERRVAIKRLLGEYGRSQQAYRRFLTEAKSVAALNHFNIVQIYDFGQDADGPFIVMELVDGQSLAERLEAGPLELTEAIDLTTQLCDALQAAHDRGIVHRDIKPANVLLTSNGVPKLTDFGLARLETVEQSTHTQAGTVLGTLDFMPPEQRRDASQADALSDQWSLAATFYQLATGELPRVIDGSLLPEAVRDVVLRALKTSPADRFATIRELGRALSSALTPQSEAADPLALADGQCPSCGVINETSRKFCKGCGGSLLAPCPGCSEPSAVWDRFCGSCGFDVHERLHEQLAEADSLRSEVSSLRAAYRHADVLARLEPLLDAEHPALAASREWATETHEKLSAELDTLQQQCEQLVAAAREQLSQGKFAAAQKYLGQIPEPLRSDDVTSLVDDVAAQADEAKQLGTLIQEAIKTRSYDGLLGQVDRYLQLKPGDATAQKLRERLLKREQQRQAKAAANEEFAVEDDASDAAAEPVPIRSASRRSSGRRRRAGNQTAMIIGGSLLLGIVLIAFFAFRGSNPQPQLAETTATRGADGQSSSTQDSAASAPGDATAVAVATELSDVPVRLFNGRDLSGWEYATTDLTWSTANDVWTVDAAEQTLIADGGDHDNCYLQTVADYEDFDLSFEFRETSSYTRAFGVMVRTRGPHELPLEGLEPWLERIPPRGRTAVTERGDRIALNLRGIHLPVRHGSLRAMGTAVTGREPSRTKPDFESWDATALPFLKPTGNWNTARITCDGDTIIARINEQIVNDLSGVEAVAGRIAFKFEGGSVALRNIEIRDVAANVEPTGDPAGNSPPAPTATETTPASDVIVALSTPDDWDDWRCHQANRIVPGFDGGWQLDQSGVLSTTDRPDHGSLFTAREFTDFELSLDYRLTTGANSGILFRRTGQAGTWGDAFLELQLIDDDGWRPQVPGVVLEAVQRNGSLYGMAAPRQAAGKPAGQWNSLVLRSVGPQITATLNGTQIIDLDLLKSPETQPFLNDKAALRRGSGLIGLQKHKGTVSFRNITLTDLTKADEELTAWIVGNWTINWSQNRNDSSGTSKYRFDSSGAVYKEQSEIGEWAATGGFVALTFDDPQRGQCRITKQDQNHLSGGHTWQNGIEARWYGTRQEGESGTGSTARTVNDSLQQARNPVPAGAVAFGSSHYLFIRRVMSWQEAKQHCESLGGHLPIVTSRAENNFLRDMLKREITGGDRKEAIWLGASDAQQEGAWKWLDGSPVTFNVWGPNQPNNKQNSEHYAILWRGGVNPSAAGDWCDQPLKSDQHTVYCVCEWDAQPADTSVDGWKNILNGQDLTGWRGDTVFWSVSNGELIGKSPGNLSRGQFLILDEPQRDFELTFQFLLKEGNSGVQIRSTDWGSQGVKGPQADITYGNFALLGSLVGEGIGNARLAMTTTASQQRLRQIVDQNGWNTMTIKAHLSHVMITMTGPSGSSETTVSSRNSGAPPSGVIALQLHGGAPTEVRFRNIRLRTIGDPETRASSSSQNIKQFSGDFDRTTWRATDSQGDTYTLTFRLGGALTYDAGRGVRHNGSWKVSGDTVRITINDGVASLTGTVKNNRLEGTGQSEIGGTWNWTATLQ